ncbi:MAG: hypothetical protein ACO1NM_06880 [Sphingobium phenoxybenzoativorans]
MTRLSAFALTIAALTSALSSAAQARDSLGVFESWGAFRDPAVPRCYAIAEPARRHRDAAWRAYASIGSWPKQGVRGQIHFRLSRARAPDSTKNPNANANNRVTLGIGDRQFALVAGTADAWAPDRRTDAAIVAAIRSGTSMSVQGRDARGRLFTDVYALRGAATAIDAAALGCARVR